ncbi:ACP S-malonyltransferase [Saccharothrix stipae]
MRSLLLFDGLGGTNDHLITSLRDLRSRPENAAFFHAVYRALDDAVDYLGPDALPAGLPLEKWLGGVEPPALDSVAAGVCVHAHQLCLLQRQDAAADVVAALGHSIGLQAAVVAGVRARRLDEFLALTVTSVKLVVVSLVRAHGIAPDRGAARDATFGDPAFGDPAFGDPALGDPAFRDSAFRDPAVGGRRGRGGAPGPMASVTGMRREELHALLADFAAVSLGLANAPTAHVVSGPTADLLALRTAHADAFDRPGVSWAFLPNTIPFHSPALADVPALVRDDLAFVGPAPAPDRLELPVYAGDGARDLRHADDLVDEYLRQVFVRPIDWEPAVRHAVTDASVDRVLDCGPGAGARRFTRECLRAGDRAVRVETFHPHRPAG